MIHVSFAFAIGLFYIGLLLVLVSFTYDIRLFSVCYRSLFRMIQVSLTYDVGLRNRSLVHMMSVSFTYDIRLFGM